MTLEAAPVRSLKRAIVGRPMASGEIEETLLPKTLALPIFASDPLSSVAYATESALVVLVAASAAAAYLVFPISIAIAVLLAIVIASYRQTVQADDTSGGAYIVAKDNLGTFPSLLGAAALLTDYVLTVAVSIAAGIFAVTSLAPSLESHKVLLSLGCLGVIVLVNLRGVRESGLAFALPTYAFVASMFALVGVGLVKTVLGEAPHAVVPHPVATGAGGVSLFVLLRAFSSGSTALTGVEAIANGVNAFRRPHGRNAATTLAILGVIAIVLFLGVSFIAVHEHARPSQTASVVSQIARATFPAGSAAGFLYYAVQVTTLLILVLAANTSFQGFPRLAALLARDNFAPRQFTNLGDRLVFSNGMLVLATLAGLLIWIYGANVNSLIHLYVIGVFTAFTLSQAGMVRYWKRVREPGWRYRALINGVGATATGIVAAIVIVTKFAAGAWLVTVAIPVLVLVCYGIRRHYRGIARRLRAGADAVVAAPPPRNSTLLLVESIDEATADALWFTEQTGNGFRAIHVPARGTDPGIKPRWFRFTDERSHLELLDASLGITEAVLEQVWRLPRGESSFVTVVIPELFQRPSLLEVFKHPRALLLKLRLLAEPGVVVADVPALVGADAAPRERAVVRVLVSGVNASSMRAVNYARTLGIKDTRAVNFAFSSEEAEEMRREWAAYGTRIPLELDDAPYRDIGTPLRAYLRDLTDDGRTKVVLVMPELVVRGLSRALHNQKALYLKRLLLFEPHVILASVPYQLLR
ncbi:MAG: APC family permease [Actinobacteria bacterium]|nr:MAG: APC family permease [Actinomycetota bacterium]